ncbi:hypothetical protein Tco_1155929 [Tanacetum coccineum]
MITSYLCTLHARRTYVEAVLQAPPSPDYVLGSEEPEQAPPSPDYVPGPEHADDEIVAEDQPYAKDASPMAQSPDYVPESDLGDPGGGCRLMSEVRLKKMDVEIDEEAEAEHLALAYPCHFPVPAWLYDSEVAIDLLAISLPNRSHLSRSIRSLRLSSCMIRIPDAHHLANIRAPTSFPPLLLPSASHREDRPEVNLPPRKRLGIALGPRYEVGESSAAAAARPAGGLRADYGFVATMDREIRRDPERYVGYGITDSWDDIVETLQGASVSTYTELGAHVRDFESMVRRDTNEIYTMLDDEQSQRRLLADRVNMLFRDRCGHAHTRLLMETEARMSREAWVRSMDASDLDRAEVISLRTTVHAQMSEITELQLADRNRRRAISDLLETDRGRREEMRELRAADGTQQQQIIQTLTVMQTLQREMIPLQGLVTTLQGQKMAPKRATRSTPVTTTPAPTAATTTMITNAQLQAMINQGVSAVLAARDATRNGVDSHTSGTGVRGSERVARECTYQDFMKCKTLYFKGTEGLVELTQWFERMETVFRISTASE